MSGTRRAGLIVSGIAAALWLVVLVAFYAPAPEEGVSIGGAMLAMLAFPLSIVGSVILLVALRGDAGLKAVGVPRRAAAAVLSVIAIVLLSTVFIMGPTDSLPKETMVALLLSGVGAFIASFALFLLPVDSA